MAPVVKMSGILIDNMELYKCKMEQLELSIVFMELWCRICGLVAKLVNAVVFGTIILTGFAGLSPAEKLELQIIAVGEKPMEAVSINTEDQNGQYAL